MQKDLYYDYQIGQDEIQDVVSNYPGAKDYYDYSQEQINYNGMKFCDEINSFLLNNVPLSEWVMRLGVHMDIENGIDVFNRQGLSYI